MSSSEAARSAARVRGLVATAAGFDARASRSALHLYRGASHLLLHVGAAVSTRPVVLTAAGERGR